jgi:E3 SUMO-protein ligase NSE2
MPPRIRESTAAPAVRARLPSTLPSYEPLRHPLKQGGINALDKLQRQNANTNFKYLEEQLRSAIAVLTECAEEINELAAERREDTNRSSDNDDGAQDLDGKVNALTMRMDEHVRKSIDSMQDVSEMKTAMANLITTSRAAMANQSISRRRSGENTEDDGADNTQIEQSQLPDPESAPSVFFDKNITTARDLYQLQSLRIRYSEHNDYKAFKTAVFEAQHGLDAEMPHPSTWFDDNRASPAPGTSLEGGDVQSDDDLQTIRVKISTKCPLSLKEMENPVKNKSCTHVFEKSAIEAYIKETDRSSRGPKNVKTCPFLGCEQKIKLTDLFVDDVLVRKIQRIQRAREKEQTQAMELDESEAEEDWDQVDDEREKMMDDDDD